MVGFVRKNGVFGGVVGIFGGVSEMKRLITLWRVQGGQNPITTPPMGHSGKLQHRKQPFHYVLTRSKNFFRKIEKFSLTAGAMCGSMSSVARLAP